MEGFSSANDVSIFKIRSDRTCCEAVAEQSRKACKYFLLSLFTNQIQGILMDSVYIMCGYQIIHNNCV